MTAFSHLVRGLRRSSPARAHAPRLVEPLERRNLLTASALGSEFLVNHYVPHAQDTGPQTDSVAYLPNGGFVAVFTGDGGGNSQGLQDPDGVYARMYDANGVSLGQEFLVNRFTDGEQGTASVAAAADGGFVVVWAGSGRDSQTQQRDIRGIWGQRFGANGDKVGGEFLINETVQGEQSNPTIAMAPDGRFVVTWSGVGRFNGNTGEVDIEGVFYRVFAADGTPLGSETAVHSTQANAQAMSSVAIDETGDFVITWSSLAQDGSDWGVFAQRFAADGAKVGGEFRVNDNTNSDQSNSRVAMADNGDFAITWSSRTGADNSDWGVYFRRYAADGTALSGDTLVNQHTNRDQRYSKVAMDGAGNFVISWDSASQDGNGWGVYAREFSPGGSAAGDEFRVNDATIGSQHHSSLAMTDDGRILILFNGIGSGDDAGVFARRYSTSTEAPILGDLDASFTIAEGNELTFTATATDPDGSASDLRFSLDSGAPEGATIDPATGVFRWTPTEAQGPGSFTVVVRVTDQRGASDSQAITINVTEVNQDPVITQLTTFDVEAGQSIQILVPATDADLPANTLVFALGSGAPAGASLTPQPNNATLFRFDSTVEQAGQTLTFTINVTDGNGGTDSTTFTVVVGQPANRAPDLQPIGDRTVNEGELLTFTLAATDPDTPAQTLTFAVTGLPPGAMFDPVTRTFTWTPDESQGPGTFDVTFTVTDSGNPAMSDSETITITVVEVNRSPNLQDIDDQTVNEGELLTFTASATDPDLPANLLTFSLDDSAPEGAAIDPVTGVFTWTPTAGQVGTFTIIVLVTDNGSPALADSETFMVTVNDVNSAPAIAEIAPITIDELQQVAFTASATDPEGNNFTWSLGAGAPEGAAIDPTTGAFTWTPTEAQGPGEYTITLQATDDGDPAATGTRQVTITVNEVNMQPFLTNLSGHQASEGDQVQIQFTAFDIDQPAQTLTFSLVSGPAGAAITANGLFTYETTEADGGQTLPITIRVEDGAGGSAEATVNLVIEETNQAPELTPIGDRALPADFLTTFTVSATDADLPAQTLTLSATNLPDGATFDPLTGVFSWTPTAAQVGTFQVTFSVSDGELTDEETVTFEVVVNNPPQLQDIADQSATENTPFAFTATATDADAGDTLTYSLSGDVPVGMTIDPASGAITWTPGEDEGGKSYEITVTVTDDGAGPLSDSDTFVVTVNEDNQAPTITPIDDKMIGSGQTLTLTVQATDADTPAQTLTFALVNPPDNASINPTTGEFTFTPSEAQVGMTFTIEVQVSDGTAMATETFLVEVPANAPPVLAPIGDKTLNELDTLTFTLSATDPEGTAIQYSMSGAPGAATLTPLTGVFNFSAFENLGGQEFTITFTATDADGQSTSETITLSILVVNEPPAVQQINAQTVQEGQTLDFQVTVFDIDDEVGWNNFTYSVDGPDGVAIDGSGRFTWTPTEAQGPGDYQVTISVTDSGIPPESSSRTFMVTVTEANEAPVFAPVGGQQVGVGQLLSVDLDATDADLPAQTITYSLGGSIPTGAAIDPASGVFTWTPDASAGGNTFTITVNASDGTATATTTFDVTVVSGNLPPEIDPIQNYTIVESQTLEDHVHASDPEGGTVTFSLGAGAPPAMEIDPATGEFRWTTTEADGPEIYLVTIIATDDGVPAASASRTFTITVNEDNEPPTINSIEDQTVEEGDLLSFQVVAMDFDEPTQTLAYEIIGAAPAGAVLNSTSGLFTWTPSVGQAQETPYNLTLRVTDALGAFSQTVVSITVTEAAMLQPTFTDLVGDEDFYYVHPNGGSTGHSGSTGGFDPTDDPAGDSDQDSASQPLLAGPRQLQMRLDHAAWSVLHSPTRFDAVLDDYVALEMSDEDDVPADSLAEMLGSLDPHDWAFE